MSTYVLTVRDNPADATSVDTEINFSQDETVRIIRGDTTMDVLVSEVVETDVYMLGQGLKLVDVIGVSVED